MTILGISSIYIFISIYFWMCIYIGIYDVYIGYLLGFHQMPWTDIPNWIWLKNPLWGVLSTGVTQNWMVYKGKSICKWKIRGYPNFRKPPYFCLQDLYLTIITMIIVLSVIVLFVHFSLIGSFIYLLHLYMGIDWDKLLYIGILINIIVWCAQGVLYSR